MSTVIQIKNVSKQYRLGQVGTGTISRDLQAWWAGIRGKENPNLQIGTENKLDSVDGEYVWALRDINFEVKQGEVLGIIGKNGAGKSTLLKILSRVTTPTTGEINVKGRIASLLEVGTGFHPELTGRENIFLNGAILGMTKQEIKIKFDEIVDFSGVEKYIDTPVKRYSSGMYVRLAFAVAAHLDPEILVVDEVLAVGDAEFQKKALGKMQDVSKEQGRVVLFVSHNIPSIKQLCSRCLLMEKGKIVADGETSYITDLYLRNTIDFSGTEAEKYFLEDTKKEFQLLTIRLLDENSNVSTVFDCDKSIKIELICIARLTMPTLYGVLKIINRENMPVFTTFTHDFLPDSLDSLSSGKYKIQIVIPARTLGSGHYKVWIVFRAPQSHKNINVDYPEFVCSFELNDNSTLAGNRREGFISTLIKWNVEKQS